MKKPSLDPLQRISYVKESNSAKNRTNSMKSAENSADFHIKAYSASALFFERRILTMIPRIRAQAIAVIVTLPMDIAMPPIPEISITDVVKRFALSTRFTFRIILRPETAMKP